MIESIYISNYALIERSELQLGKGFTVITGETGAGKSILLGALGLALGGRADSAVVRDKAGKCVVEVTFDIADYALNEWFKDNDLDYEVQAVVRRQISGDGKSRAFINDTPVTLKQLKEFGSYLIDIHSQHESLLLGKGEFQTELLDAFCGNSELLNKYSEIYGSRVVLLNQLRKAQEELEQAESEREFLSYRFNMLQSANLRVGEALELEEEQSLLQNAEQIKGGLEQLVYTISDSDSNLLAELKLLRASMDKISQFLPMAGELEERLKSVSLELSDMADEANRKSGTIEADPKRLQFVEERLGELYDLQLKFKVDNPDELVAVRDSINEKLAAIEENGELVDTLKRQLKECEDSLRQIALELHQARVNAEPSLVKIMTELLLNLGINHPRFKVNVVDTERFMVNGCDSVSILFAANKNQEPGEIANMASGGEISRVMLAFKYVLAKCRKMPVMIFDEIDTGLSGQIAHKMGQMMSEMGGFMQVIAISHLPQIASAGNAHFKVYKEDSEVETVSRIKLLNGEERVMELAMMMSGGSVTPEALKAAERLLSRE